MRTIPNIPKEAERPVKISTRRVSKRQVAVVDALRVQYCDGRDLPETSITLHMVGTKYPKQVKHFVDQLDIRR